MSTARYFDADGNVARMREDGNGLHVELYDVRVARFVSFPAIVGKITGAGGDGPLAVIDRAAAARMIATLRRRAAA